MKILVTHVPGRHGPLASALLKAALTIKTTVPERALSWNCGSNRLTKIMSASTSSDNTKIMSSF